MWELPVAQVTAAAVLLGLSYIQLSRLTRMRTDLARLEEEARFATEERRAERAGRIKAERELRQLQLRLGQLESSQPAPLPPQLATRSGRDASGEPGDESNQQQQQQQQEEHQEQQELEAAASSGRGRAGSDPLDFLSMAFPLRPIGVLRSCFTRRNGTPRQPLLVGAARARLKLRPDMNADFLEGLQQYSHCWVLYIFHENTDLQRLWQAEPDSGVRAKIRVPRLDGGRMGVFATRSPHRPCPIGLSVAQVVAVEGRTLVLGGADIVDGSPVLDIKPYVPFCDSAPDAKAPSWVAAQADDEPLSVGALRIPPAVEAALQQCWWQLGPRSLYSSFKQYMQLVEEVLSRDIRSVTQRVKVPKRAQKGGPAALCQLGEGQAAGLGGSGSGSAAAEGVWKVALDGIQISYDVEEGSSDVVLRSAHLA